MLHVFEVNVQCMRVLWMVNIWFFIINHTNAISPFHHFTRHIYICMSVRIQIVDCTAVESGCLHGNFEKWKLPCKSPVPTALHIKTMSLGVIILSFMPGLTSAFQSQIPFYLHHFYPFLLSLRPYNVRTHYARHIFSKFAAVRSPHCIDCPIRGSIKEAFAKIFAPFYFPLALLFTPQMSKQS